MMVVPTIRLRMLPDDGCTGSRVSVWRCAYATWFRAGGTVGSTPAAHAVLFGHLSVCDRDKVIDIPWRSHLTANEFLQGAIALLRPFGLTPNPG